VRSSHALAITKSGPATVAAGGQIAYTLSYTVAGNETAQNVVIDDNTPANTTFASATGTGVQAPPAGSTGLVRWQLGNLTPGTSGTVTLVVSVNSPLANGTIINNLATASDANGGTAANASWTTTVTSGHAFTLSKLDTPDPVTPNGLLNYTLHWTVTGNEPALNMVITDALPANTTFWSCGSCGYFGNTVSWDLGSRSPGTSGDVFLQVRVNTPLVNGTILTNTARVSDGNGGTPAAATTTTTVASDHNLTIKKSAPVSIGAGNVIVYTIDYNVTGSELATGVTITDAIPANTTYEPGTCTAGCVLTGGVITWNLGNLEPGSVGTVQFGARSDSLLANGTVVTNTARIFDAYGKSAAGTATTRIGSAANLTLIDERDTVKPGDLITYTVTYSGVEPLNNGRIQIDLPANTTFVRASAGYVNGSDAALWFLAPQPANFYGQRYLVVQVLPVLDNGTIISTTAYLSGDGQSDHTSASARVVSAPAWATSAKTADRYVVEPSARLTYTVDLHNTGNMNAHFAVVTDTLPAGVTYVNGSVSASSGAATYDAANNRIKWNGAAPVGSGTRITYVVTINANVTPGTHIINSALLDDEINNPAALSNQVSVIAHEPRTYKIYLPIVLNAAITQELPDLTITQMVAIPASLPAGQTGWNVQITVKNVGTAPLPNGVWMDLYVDPVASRLPIHANEPFYEISTYGGVWWLPQLNPGESVVLSKAEILPDWLPFFPDRFTTPGDHVVYAQIDSLDERTTPPPAWARVYESNENNNIFGPVIVHVTGVTNLSMGAADALPDRPIRQAPR
jgi:uncharacterized repeat protein (TIGR01451 family)